MPIPDDTAWRTRRRQSIQRIKKLRSQLDNICVYCNYGKGVGRIAQIGGAATSVVGFILSIGGYSLAQILMNVGNLIQHSGALVEGALNAAETCLSTLCLIELQAVLDRDQELSLPLQTLFQELSIPRLVNSANLNATIRELFGCDLASAHRKNALTFYDQVLRVHIRRRCLQQTFALLKRGRYSLHLGTDAKLEYLKDFTTLINGNPALADTMSILRILVSYIQIYVCKNLWGWKSPPELPSIREGIDLDSQTVPRFCTFQAINTETNIVSLIKVVKVIKGATSGYSDALQQLSDLLELELVTHNFTCDWESNVRIHVESAVAVKIGRRIRNISDEFA